ncbi:MAG: hypothetical protein PHV51_06215 [Methanosarcinaceae archaeon]|nr:hypothetical protein [Methanosarcinaceae archaeon]MDD4497728.1 hypothetical protein [Methanosarcinaceae archaeon]
MDKTLEDIFENLSDLTIYLIIAVGFFLVVLFFTLMSRYAEAESLSLVILMALLASLTAVFIMRLLVFRLHRSS